MKARFFPFGLCWRTLLCWGGILWPIASLIAQSDVVLLQNQTEIKGKIVEEIPGEWVKIQDSDYQLHSIPSQDIQRVSRPLAIKGFWEVIHLHQGGSISGFLVEYEWLRSIKIGDTRRNLFEYKWHEIARIVKEPLPNDETLLSRSGYLMKKTRQKGKSDSREAYPGYGLFFVEGGGMVSTLNGDQSRLFPGIFGQAILSMYLSETFTLGVGAGIDRVQREPGVGDVGQYGFVDGRWYLPQEGWNPYFALAGGYDWYRRGGYINPGLGIRKKVFNKFWLNGNVSLKLQQIGEQTFSDTFEPGMLEMVQLKLVID